MHLVSYWSISRICICGVRNRKGNAICIWGLWDGHHGYLLFVWFLGLDFLGFHGFQSAQHVNIDGSQVLVDYNRQLLMPGWIPRRLGKNNLVIHPNLILSVEMITFIEGCKIYIVPLIVRIRWIHSLRKWIYCLYISRLPLSSFCQI